MTERKRKRTSAIPYIAVMACTVYALFAGSCANTSTPPSGGPKDTIPPVVTMMTPDSNALYVPRHKTRLEFKFDEYVVIKDANANVLLSPPQEKKPTLKIRGKSVIVTFDQDLDSARTYNLSLGNAIADNNEGNLYTFFYYPFSTGGALDSMYCTGSIVDARTLYPKSGITIGFYKDHEDSVLYKRMPDAVAMSDMWGFFTARNLEPVEYRVFAFKDDNYNSRYDAYTEETGFLDTLFTPTKVMKGGIRELGYFDMKDTLECLARPFEFEIRTFMEISPNQFIRDYKRDGVRSMYVKFAAPYAQIDSMWFEKLDSIKLITEFNVMKDSLCIWINDPGDIPDTLNMGIKYLATDTLNQLVPTYDTLRYILPKELRKNKDERKKFEKKDENAPREDLLEFELLAEADMVEQYGIGLQFKSPLVELNRDSISFRYVSPRKQEGDMEYTLEQDSLTLLKYTIRPKDKFLPGYDYTIIFKQATFKDINAFTNDSTAKTITLPNADNLSSLTLVIKNVSSIYIVDLVNEKRDKTLRSFTIDTDTTLLFPYINAGKYSIRVTEDLNRNSLFDTGSILERKQPEKVMFYKLPDGSDLLDIPEKSDLEQNIDMRLVTAGKAAAADSTAAVTGAADSTATGIPPADSTALSVPADSTSAAQTGSTVTATGKAPAGKTAATASIPLDSTPARNNTPATGAATIKTTETDTTTVNKTQQK